MKKRITGLLLSLILLFCVSAQAEEPVWSYDGNNMYLKLDGTLSGDVVIPSEVDGFAVSAIEDNAFYEQHEVTSLTMPDSLRALKSGAVTCMDSLTSITLNNGLEYIGSNFTNCAALTSLTIPASVRIVDGIIGSCENLKEIHFEGPCPLFLRADWCFYELPADYTVYVPDDQLDAYSEALSDANGAAEHLQPSGKNAVIPEQENAEGWFSFDASTGTITGYSEYHAFIEIPASIGGVAVKSIGQDAFHSDYSVYGVVFPEGLERIDDSAFHFASNINYVKFPSTLKTIGDDAFFNAHLNRIDWSEGLETIGARAFQYNNSSINNSILALPSTVKTIGESAFESSWCYELYLGSNVESIGARAFANSPIDYMVFDLYSPIDIAPDAFADTYVTDLDLPWDSSFENRDAYAEILKDQCPDCTVWINNPESGGVAECPVNEPEITTIEDGVWTAYAGDAPDLTIWTDYDDINVTALGDGLFKGNQTIRSFYPHHCGWFTTIGAEAFADSSVEYVEMFGSITTIGNEAFRNCVNITDMPLPESLTSIGAGAFKGCTGITELILPASLTSIGEGAFDGCTSLKKLTVLCDASILPADIGSVLENLDEIYAASDAPDEQIKSLSALANRAWNNPITRVGEALPMVQAMPYDPLPGDDFWYDEEFSRLDSYRGYELNLILPREIDGVQLTMVGGGMMGRACYGDNFDVELPVRSLVIPETYTEFPYNAFENCETLETVVCYAPIENLPDSLFKGCTSLREVIFVNGVRSLGMYLFDGCTSLETVYLGSYVQEISDYAFLNEDQSEAFRLEDCITDPALLPDVDALLAAVKSDPMPEPTPEPTPEPARPVGPEGAAFLGSWHGVAMEMEGATYNLSDFGMVMDLNFCEDGTVTLFDGEETNVTSWKVENGMAIVDTMMGSILEDGTLSMEDDGAKVIFTHGESAAAPAVTEPANNEPVDAEGAPFLGAWHGVSIEMEGATYSLSDFGMVMDLNFCEDGTVALFDGEESVVSSWKVENGIAIIDNMMCTILDDGTLSIEDDGAKIIFTHGEATSVPTVSNPDVNIPEIPEEDDMNSYVGTWHACYLVTGGMTGDPRSLMNLDITLELNDDGTGTLTFPEAEEKIWYQDAESGTVYFGEGGDAPDMPMTLLEGGYLQYGSAIGDGNALGGYIIFSQDPDAIWTPELTVGPAGSATDDPSVSMDERLEKKYICISADVSGYTMDGSMLGGEYSMTFHADGTMDFVMVGTSIPGLGWTQGTVQTDAGEATAFLVDYYGSILEAVCTEEGFDMNYFDSMLMHFVPEQ